MSGFGGGGTIGNGTDEDDYRMRECQIAKIELLEGKSSSLKEAGGWENISQFSSTLNLIVSSVGP